MSKIFQKAPLTCDSDVFLYNPFLEGFQNLQKKEKKGAL